MTTSKIDLLLDPVREYWTKEEDTEWLRVLIEELEVEIERIFEKMNSLNDEEDILAEDWNYYLCW